MVYVDHDPDVTRHAGQLPAGIGGAEIIGGDVRDPGAILGHPVTRKLLDFSQSADLVLVSILHFIGDSGRTHELVRRYLSAHLLTSDAEEGANGRGYAIRPRLSGNGTKPARGSG